MKEPHRKGLASHPDPESCAGNSDAAREALTGAHVDQPLSCEIKPSRVPTLLVERKTISQGASRQCPADPAQSKTLCMRGNSLHGTREVPQVPGKNGRSGRPGKAIRCTPGTYARGKSDSCIVPKKLPNNAQNRAAEAVEGRRLTKGNTPQTASLRTQSREGLSNGLLRVREAERPLLRHAPEVGAVCGKAARTDLRGGRQATGVPTATTRAEAKRFKAASTNSEPGPVNVGRSSYFRYASYQAIIRTTRSSR